MKRAYIIIAALAVMSWIVGWWQAGHYVGDGTVEPDDWSVSSAQSASFNASQISQRLRASELFLLSRKDEAIRKDGGEVGGSDDPAGPGAAPPFPTIAAAALVNGVSQINLVSGDGTVMTAKAGDTLPNGWMIKTVDLTQVIAVFNGEETRFSVRPFLDSAFDNPEDETLQTSTPDTPPSRQP